MKTITALISAIVVLALGISQELSNDIQFVDEITVNDAEEYSFEEVYCSVDASTVSLGKLADVSNIEFKGQNCAEILLIFLEANGLEPIYYGTTDSDFYLSGIGGIDTSNASVAENLIPFLNDNGVKFDSAVAEEGVLGEFDFTESAGWIYIVNGEIPNVGMDSYIPNAGDEIEFVFTLYYGEDIYLVN